MTDARAPYMPDVPLLILAVGPEAVDAVVVANRSGRRATDQSFRVTWTPAAGWRCTCPATTSGCSHLGAVRAIVVAPPAAAQATR